MKQKFQDNIVTFPESEPGHPALKALSLQKRKFISPPKAPGKHIGMAILLNR